MPCGGRLTEKGCCGTIERMRPSLALFVLLPLAPLMAQDTPADLADRPGVRRAMMEIDRLHDRTIRDLITLTEIPAPPFGEADRAQAYAEMLHQAGADSVWLDEVGNVLALRRGTVRDRTVVLSAHLDTVFPEGTDVTVRVRGDTLFAPGVSDDTRGLIAVLTVLRAMRAADLRARGDILFVGTVGEEGLGDLRGVKHLFREGGKRIDAFISVDGSNASRIVHEALGSHRYRVTYRGPGGHSWGAFGLANPHHALGTAVDRFAALAGPFTATGTRTSYNVGRIGGGTSVNSIAYESWMEVDMRSESPERLLGIDSLFQRAVREGLTAENERRRRGPALTVEVKMIGERPSGSIPLDHPVVQWAAESARYFGYQPSFARSSTDSNIPISLGIPAVTLGGGGVGANAHSLDEYWVNEDSDRGIRFVLLVTMGLGEGSQGCDRD